MKENTAGYNDCSDHICFDLSGGFVEIDFDSAAADEPEDDGAVLLPDEALCRCRAGNVDEGVEETACNGGGGTNVKVVLDYVKSSIMHDPPCCIVTLTDGWMTIPDEKAAMGIPVVWLFAARESLPKWDNGAYVDN